MKRMLCSKERISAIRVESLALERLKAQLKTDCQFSVHFCRHQATGIYSFTDTYDLVHNHPMDPASTTMSALARRFTPTQSNLIDALHSMDVPVTSIVEELRKATNATFQKKDVYNNLQQAKKKKLTDKYIFWTCFRSLIEMKTLPIKSVLTVRSC